MVTAPSSSRPRSRTRTRWTWCTTPFTTITRKTQADAIIEPSGVSTPQKKVSYDFTYAYNPSGVASQRPHAPTHIGVRTYSYDADGNQTGWTQDTQNSNPNGNTPFEKDIFFYHPDHIGSTNYVTDVNGKLYEHLEYFPFGEAWVEENSNQQRTPFLFSAKELDEETGLYSFGRRYYDPRTSVWQSVDPILNRHLGGTRDGGVYNSFNLALFAYSYQNPIRLVDPDGMAPLDATQWAHVKAETRRFEGLKNYMYADSLGFVTIGPGQMLPNAQAAAALNLTNTATGTAATTAEKTSAFSTVTSAYSAAMSKGPKATAPAAERYEPLTTVRMSNADIESKLESGLRSTQNELRNIFKGFDDFPVEAQMGLMDMGYNVGAANLPGKFPKLTNAVTIGDWATAAKESNRPQVSSTRNQAIRGLFERA